MKNFRTWLNINENAEGGTKELYHATLSGPNNEILNSFIHNGIDPQKSKGYFQGGGFFVFQDKNIAINHAKDVDETQDKKDPFFKKEVEVKGKPIIIVVDEPITPECFDIDYEAFSQAFSRFMYDNFNFFQKHANDLNMFIHSKYDDTKRVFAAFNSQKIPDSVLRGVRFTPRGEIKDQQTVSPEEGGEYSKFAEKLAKLDPNMFNKFEEEYLHLSPAIKYNCKKKIWPARIEDINGKILWQRN